MAKKAFITGITGQDGSYLAEFLLSKGYEVHGLIRRSSTPNTGRLVDLEKDVHKPETKVFLHYGELGDASSLTNLLYDVQPDEIYHLGAQSHVRVSFDTPEFTGDVTGLSTTRVLEAMRRIKTNSRFYQASSSEMFGSECPPQREITPFHPRSPYGAAKVYAYWLSVNYREAYNLFVCNGILFNHESPRRGVTFVTRKITTMLTNVLLGKQQTIYLGNLDAKRDWGFAPDYVEAMHLMLQQEVPDDYVVGTGEAHSIEDFLDEAFGYADMDWHDYVRIDPRYYRPTEVDFLEADNSKAKKKLDWEPKVRFPELVRIMVDADLELAGLDAPGDGEKIFKAKFSDWHRWEHQVVSMGQ